VKMTQTVFLFLVLETLEMMIRLLRNPNKLMQCLRKRAVKVKKRRRVGSWMSVKKRGCSTGYPKTRYTCSNIDSRCCHFPFSFGNGLRKRV
jgi:hypothetical protein